MTLFVILLIVFIAFGIGIGYLAYVVKTEKKDILPLLTILIKYGLAIFIVLSLILTIVSLFVMTSEIIMIAAIIKQVIDTIYYVIIYKLSTKLLDNLNKKDVFLMENSTYIKQIGLNFLYLSLMEIVVGLFLGWITFSSTGTFNMATNNTIYIYVIVALVFEVIALILRKATLIYEENKLTI